MLRLVPKLKAPSIMNTSLLIGLLDLKYMTLLIEIMGTLKSNP